MIWDKVHDYLTYVLHSYDLWRIAIELCVIGFIVYSLMRFLRGTGGEKLFKGIVVLLFGFWAINLITRIWQLDRIGLLYNYLLVTVLVIAAVAFQPELRRGLMQLGGTRFSRVAVPQMQQAIEYIIDSASFLSKEKIGALIAIERQVGLSDLVSHGTRIDSEISADLLNTIFWPGTPLHDMGVVIRGGRLLAAGVQFPLAEHGDYDRLLGSRHRAAIGLSNETDAVVVVVSEETGHIALACDGKLTRFLTLEQLRQQLLDLIVPAVSKEELSLWDRIKNLWKPLEQTLPNEPKTSDKPKTASAAKKTENP